MCRRSNRLFIGTTPGGSGSPELLTFTAISELLLVKDNYPANTIFNCMTEGDEFIMGLRVDADGDLAPVDFIDFTKLSAFLDDPAYQFADVTGATNITLDAEGLSFDVESGGAVYWKGFKAGTVYRSMRAMAELTAGNETPSASDLFWAGWITDPLVAYTLHSGGIGHNGTNWRQYRMSGSNAAAPTTGSGATNLGNSPGVAPTNWALYAHLLMAEEGADAGIWGGNLIASGEAVVNDGSGPVVSAIAAQPTSGKVWHPCFGARSVSVGTAHIKIKSARMSFGSNV